MMRTFLILVWDNLKNSLRTRKAFVFLLFYLLVFGLIAYGFFTIQENIDTQIQQQHVSGLQKSFMLNFGRTVIANATDDSAVVQFLFLVPLINIVFFFVSLIGTPLLIFILNYDKIAQEVYDGTIRYILFRASRFQIFFAKFTSSMIECSLITFIALVLGVLWGSIRFPHSVHFDASMSYGIRYWVIAQFFLATFVALSLMASAIFKKPFVALIFCFTCYVLMPGIPLVVRFVSPYDHLYFEGLFFHNSPELIFSLAVYTAYAALLLTTGYQIFKRKDL
jgi:ABC-type transport system involved in multi-copper enzyme maturation permease subunit